MCENDDDGLECREIADLKPHPRQAELFEDLSDHELRRLADDIIAVAVKLERSWP